MGAEPVIAERGRPEVGQHDPSVGVRRHRGTGERARRLLPNVILGSLFAGGGLFSAALSSATAIGAAATTATSAQIFASFHRFLRYIVAPRGKPRRLEREDAQPVVEIVRLGVRRGAAGVSRSGISADASPEISRSCRARTGHRSC